MKRIDVAVGIILNEIGEVLVGQRTIKDQYFEKWEFPGGKLEENETSKEALLRELKEELGIDVIESQEAMTLKHDYPDSQVRLFVQEVIKFNGKPQGLEQQVIQWVEINKLQKLDMLDGNWQIIDYLIESDH